MYDGSFVFRCKRCEEMTSVDSLETAIKQEKLCIHCYKVTGEALRLNIANRHQVNKFDLNQLRRDGKHNKQQSIKPTEFVCTYCARSTGVVTIQPKKCKVCTGTLIKKSRLSPDYVFGKDRIRPTYDELIGNS